MPEEIKTVEPAKMYIPKGCNTLAINKDQQIRLGIQSFPGQGKTWSALTFPNCVVLNMDRGLTAHVGREDVIEVPMWNPTYVDNIAPRDTKKLDLPNIRDALLIWLAKEGTQLNAEQTLVVDSLSQLENSFHIQFVPSYTKNLEEDKREVWRDKIVYFSEIFEWFKALKCNVILPTHETADRDKEGDINHKVRPLITGQTQDKIVGHFTDWYRQLAVAKPLSKAKEELDKFKAKWGLEDDTMSQWLSSTPQDCRCIYLWQTQSDDKFSAKAGSLVGAPKYILADYKSFLQYRRKLNINTK